jgi:bacteriorhodopsin
MSVKLAKVTAVNASFYLTFLALLGTTAATVIASLYPGSHSSDENKILADALLLEVTVNFIATYFYSLFVRGAETGHIDVKRITPFRYLDWALTTPFLLSAIILYFHYLRYKVDNTEKVNFRPLAILLPLNWLMLYSGYIGETNSKYKWSGLTIGFIAFASMAYILWTNYVKDTVPETKWLFLFFVVTWGLYGVAYLLKDKAKNIAYNALDLVAKVLFSLYTIFVIINNNHS